MAEKCRAKKRVEFGDQWPSFEVSCKKKRDHIATALDNHLATITFDGKDILMDISWPVESVKVVKP